MHLLNLPLTLLLCSASPLTAAAESSTRCTMANCNHPIASAPPEPAQLAMSAARIEALSKAHWIVEQIALRFPSIPTVPAKSDTEQDEDSSALTTSVVSSQSPKLFTKSVKCTTLQSQMSLDASAVTALENIKSVEHSIEVNRHSEYTAPHSTVDQPPVQLSSVPTLSSQPLVKKRDATTKPPVSSTSNPAKAASQISPSTSANTSAGTRGDGLAPVVSSVSFVSGKIPTTSASTITQAATSTSSGLAAQTAFAWTDSLCLIGLAMLACMAGTLW